jgi:hypothetical protein
MNVLTRYSFISQFNKEQLSRQEAKDNGIGTADFSKCDADGDGILTVDELLANQDVCDKLLKALQGKKDAISAQESALKSELAKEENSSERFKAAA